MAWKAKIIRVGDTNVGTANMDVNYYNGDVDFTKTYNLEPQSFDTSEKVINFVKQELISLNTFQEVVEEIKQVIDQEIE